MLAAKPTCGLPPPPFPRPLPPIVFGWLANLAHVLVAQLDILQDAEFMEQKKSERAACGVDAWQPQARQQELDEADRFQVSCLGYSP